jgi:negative regulator of replication initiation
VVGEGRKLKVIGVDDEVFKQLRRLAAPGESPNTVMRRVLELPPVKQPRRSNTLKPFRSNNGGQRP